MPPLRFEYIPPEPAIGVEHDFRQTPTRITAYRFAGGVAPWFLFEFAPGAPREILSIRQTWEEIFDYAESVVRFRNWVEATSAYSEGMK